MIGIGFKNFFWIMWYNNKIHTIRKRTTYWSWKSILFSIVKILIFSLKHDQPVKTINCLEDQNLLLTGSWDKKIKYWDIRQSKEVATIDMPERVYSVSVKDNICVIATAGKHVLVYDLVKLQTPLQVRMNLKINFFCSKLFRL